MENHIVHASVLPSINRRVALGRLAGGFGLVGFANVLGDSLLQAATPNYAPNSLVAKPPQFPAKAKRIIFLFMNGGLSQVDTFDPKPMLAKYNGQPLPGGNLRTERSTGNLMQSPFSFKQCGKSGIGISDIFPRLGESIDDICVVRSMFTDVPNHEPSLFMMNCGHIQSGRPSMGSWCTYGLGTENQNMPGFVVMCPGSPSVGSSLWNSAFLPAVYQGTFISNKETDPQKLIPYIRNDKLTAAAQRRQVELVAQLDRMQQPEGDAQLDACIQSMETAYRMQTEAPTVFDVSKESESTRTRYGDGDFGRGCLMALRLVESGVRIVQIYFGNSAPWDSHEDITNYAKLAHQADAPMAALLQDLKSRGLLKDTLVICGTEFGRTPVVELSGAVKIHNGRDHNSHGFSVWMAGGGVKGGMTYGATDDFGFKAVENPVHVHDLHATILYLLGLDHTKLTYRYSGRDFRLTDVGGRVVKEILA